jgi:hypothetical protein
MIEPAVRTKIAATQKNTRPESRIEIRNKCSLKHFSD